MDFDEEAGRVLLDLVGVPSPSPLPTVVRGEHVAIIAAALRGAARAEREVCEREARTNLSARLSSVYSAAQVEAAYRNGGRDALERFAADLRETAPTFDGLTAKGLAFLANLVDQEADRLRAPSIGTAAEDEIARLAPPAPMPDAG
jgi:hypothetical protein